MGEFLELFKKKLAEGESGSLSSALPPARGVGEGGVASEPKRQPVIESKRNQGKQTFLEMFRESLRKEETEARLQRQAEAERAADEAAAAKGKENIANRSEFTRGLLRGIDQTQATFYGGLGMLSSAMGDDKASDLRFQQYREQMRQASENPATVDEFFSTDPKKGAFGSVGNFGAYAAGTIGSLLPTIAESAVAGVAGAAIGGAIVPAPDPTDVVAVPVGFIGGVLGRGAMKKAIAETAKRYVARGVASEAAQQMGERAVKNALAKRIGATIGTSQITALQEGGGMYAEGREAGYDNPWSAILLGQASGASEGVLGNVPFALRTFIGRTAVREAAQKFGAKEAAGLLWDAVKNAGEEAVQESFQEFLGDVNSRINDPNDKIFTKENFKQWAESGAAGALAGGILGGGGVATQAALDARRRQLEGLRAKGFISKEEAKDNGIEGGTRREIMGNAEQELADLNDIEVLAKQESDRNFINQQQQAQAPQPQVGVQPEQFAEVPIPEDGGMSDEEYAAFRQAQMGAQGGNVSTPATVDTATVPPVVPQPTVQPPQVQPQQPAAVQPPVPQVPPIAPAVEPPQAPPVAPGPTPPALTPEQADQSDKEFAEQQAAEQGPVAPQMPTITSSEEHAALPMFSVYERNFQGQKRYGVKGSDKGGFGDPMFESPEAAQAESDRMFGYFKDQERRSEESKKKAEEATKKKADYEASFGGFLSTDPKTKGRQLKVLGKPVQSDGKATTIKDLIEQRVASGYVVNDAGQLESPDKRSVLTAGKITKTGMDYARRLIANKAQPPTDTKAAPQPEPKPAEKPVPPGMERITDWRKAVDESIESDPMRASSIMRRVAQRTSDDAVAQEILDRLPDGLADRSQVAWDIGSNRKLSEPVRRRAAKWHKEYGLGGNLDAVIDKNPSAKPAEQPVPPAMEFNVGQGARSIPGMEGDEANYTVLKRKPDVIPDTVKVVISGRPGGKGWISVDGTGMTGPEAYDRAMRKYESKRPGPLRDKTRKEAIRKAIEEQGGFESNSTDNIDAIRNKLYDGADTPTGTEIRAVMDEMKIEAGQKAEADASKPAAQPAPEGKTEAFRALPERSRAKFEELWNNKNSDSIKELLYPINKAMRSEFEARTSIKLPKTISETKEVVERWHRKGRKQGPSQSGKGLSSSVQARMLDKFDRITELYFKLENISADDQREKSTYSVEELLELAEERLEDFVLGTGTELAEDLAGLNSPEAKKYAADQKRQIEAWVKQAKKELAKNEKEKPSAAAVEAKPALTEPPVEQPQQSEGVEAALKALDAITAAEKPKPQPAPKKGRKEPEKTKQGQYVLPLMPGMAAEIDRQDFVRRYRDRALEPLWGWSSKEEDAEGIQATIDTLAPIYSEIFNDIYAGKRETIDDVHDSEAYEKISKLGDEITVGDALITSRLDEQITAALENYPKKTPKPPRKSEQTLKEAKTDLDAAHDAAQAAMEKIRAKLMSGIDPEISAEVVRVAYLYAKAGIKTFKGYVEAIVEKFGDAFAREFAPYMQDGWSALNIRGFVQDPAGRVEDYLAKETKNERDDGALPDDTGDVEKNETEPNKKPRKRRGSGGSSASGKRRNTKSRRDNEATGDGSNADSGGNRDGVSSPAGSLNNHKIGERPVWLEGGAVTKLNRNIDSIETMQVVEREGRRATPEEQSVIAQYTGWGHLKQFFIRDSDIFSLKAIEAKEWRSGAFDRLDQITEQRIREQAVRKGRTETQILAKIQREQATNKHRVRLALSMTPAEYAQARKSTRYSHYTDPAIARSMWKFLENVLPEAGKIRVLEPSEGSGMFWGTMPDSMFKRAEMHGIDMDTASSRVSKHLYPSVRHLNIPYQQSPYPEGFFDVAITNVPFNKNPVTDATEDIEDLSLHNYYFAKTAKRVREGGVVAFITTHFTMDAAVPKQREAISAQGLKFLGAVRLHQDAFGGIANTKVVTDIIIMQKVAPGLPEMELNNGFNAPARTSNVPYLGNLLEGANVFFHPYFRDKPNMIAGVITANGEMRGEGPELTVESEMTTEETAAFVDSALSSVKIDKDAFIAGEAKRNEMTEESEGSATFIPEHLKDLELGRLEVDGNRLVLRTSEDTMTIVKSKFSPAMQARAKKWFAIRDAMVNLRILQRRDDNPVDEIEKARKKLNKVYDDFVGEFKAAEGERGDYEGYKPLNTPYNKSMFSSDFMSANILALENTRLEPTGELDKNGNEKKVLRVEKASVFRERNEWPIKHRPKPKTVLEALARSLFVKGGVDVGFIAESLGKQKSDIVTELEEYAFALPDSGGWEIKEVYLSGNIAQKLQIAEKAVEQDVAFTRNVNALKEVLPVRKSFDQLAIQINSPFMPEDVLQGFVARELGLGNFNIRKNSQELGGGWIAVYDKKDDSNQTTQDRDQYAVRSGTRLRRTGFDLLVDMMAGKPTIIVDEDMDGRMVPNAALINLAKTKRADLSRAFDVYVRESQERMDYIAKAFNDRIGGYVKQNVPDWVVSLDGMADVWKDLTRSYQKVAIGKIALGGNTLLAHRVGYGKTLSGVAGVMEQIRLGVARKPIVVVPNHLTGQWAKSFADYYPSALIMAPLSTDFSKSKRQATMNRIMTGNWDAVIIPESSFKKLPMSSDYVQEFFQAQIAQAIAVIEQATADAGSDPRTIVELENIKERLENSMAKYLAESQKDPGPFFDEMGVDSLMVDEAHHYKNLPFYTQNTRIAGINPTGSQQAFDMLMKTDFINNLTGSRNVTFLTGTPIANSMTEAWVMMRYLMPEAMKDAGVFAFDDWKTTFGAVVDRTRVNTIGTGFRTESRFQEFVNIEALSKMFQQVADVQMKSNDVEVPPVSGGKPKTIVVPSSDAMKNFMLGLAARGENMPDDPSIDNMLNVMTVGAGAAIDFRLLDAAAMPAETSKLQVAADEVSRVYDMTTPFKGTQIIWSDRGVPKAAKKLTPEMKELGAWMRQQVESRPITMDEVKEKWKEIRPTKGAADELRRFMSMALQDMNFTEATDEDSDAYKVDIPDEPSVYVKDITDVDPNITEQAAPPWNVYQEMKSLLVARGVPSDQIVFIHDYKTAAQKVELFRKMNAGELRVLIGNTPRLGTGANIQERLVAAHHLDVPWRPADVEQRDGRIIRSGNRVFAWGGNKGYAELAGVLLDGVMINRYVTEGSIDARYWDTNEMKAQMLQDFWSESPGVSMEELGATTLSMAEVKAAAVANPLLREKIELETKLGRLEEEYRGALQSNAQTRGRLEEATKEVKDSKTGLQAAKDHVAWFNEGKATLPKEEVFAIVVDGKALYRRDDVAEALEAKLHETGRNISTLELENNPSAWAKNNRTNSVNVVLGTVFGKPIAASVDAGFRNRETGEFLAANSYQESKIEKELKNGKWEKSYSDAVFRLGDLAGIRTLGNNPQGFLARIRNHAEPTEGLIKAHEKALKDNEKTLADLEKLVESLSKPDNSQILEAQAKLEEISNEIGDEGNDQITYWVATEELEKALGTNALQDQLGRVDSSETLLGYVDHPDHGLLSVFNRSGDTRPPAHNMVWLEGKKATIGYVLRDEKGAMGLPILKTPQGIGTIAHPEHGELVVYDRKEGDVPQRGKVWVESKDGKTNFGYQDKEKDVVMGVEMVRVSSFGGYPEGMKTVTDLSAAKSQKQSDLDNGLRNPPPLLMQTEPDIYAGFRSQAMKLGLDAEKAGITAFEDFVAHSVKTIGTDETYKLGAYLRRVGEIVGMTGIRPVKDILGVPMTQAEYVQLGKEAFAGSPQVTPEQVEAGIEAAMLTGLPQMAVGFAPTGSPVPGQGLMQQNIKTDTPAFKKWFGDSKVVDADGKPLRLLHGTTSSFDVFSGRSFAAFGTEDVELAEGYAGEGEGAKVFPVYFKAEKPAYLEIDLNDTIVPEEDLEEQQKPSDWDEEEEGEWSPSVASIEGKTTQYELAEYFDLSESEFSSLYREALNENNGWFGYPQVWRVVNSNAFKSFLVEKGYDSFTAKEGGVDVWAVVDSTQIKSAIGNRGTFDPNNPNMLYQEEAKSHLRDEQPATYRVLDESEVPKKTRRVYKLMKRYKSRPGLLYPLFVKAQEGAFKKGEWYAAEVKSPRISNKDLAKRPGIHSVDLPIFAQGKPSAKGQDRVWVEVEIPDISAETQAESDGSPRLPNGMRTGITDRLIGTKEAYDYKTNPNAAGANAWPIAGSMKIIRVLSDADVDQVLREAGKEEWVASSLSGESQEEASRWNMLYQQEEAPRWYLKSRKLIQDKMGPKATSEQVLGMLRKNGVNDEELYWSGLEELLGSKQSVTKDEVLAAIDNGFRVEEVVLGAVDPRGRIDESYNEAREFISRNGAMTDRLERWFDIYLDTDGRDNDARRAIDDALEDAGGDSLESYEDVPSVETKFDPKRAPTLSIPGGKDYKELLITLPEQRVGVDGFRAEMQKKYGEHWRVQMTLDESSKLDRLKGISSSGQDSPLFYSSHWDQPNVIAHLRFNERMDADGKRVMFIEEVQSDWHQEGRKKGYATDAAAKLPAGFTLRNSFGQTWWVEDVNGKMVNPFKRPSREEAIGEAINGRSTSDTLQQNIATGESGVPDAPFKKSWMILAMKRAIQHAAENGFDRIAWTTGEQQADRYDLSKQVDAIQWSEKHQRLVASKMGKAVIDEKGVTSDKLEGFIGKEATKKLLEQPDVPFQWASGSGKALDGDNLKVGGEGMKAFYDKMLPNETNKLIKKFGANVKSTIINQTKAENDDGTLNQTPFGNTSEGIAVQSFDITPAMRESALQYGQTLFQTQQQGGNVKGWTKFISGTRALIGATSKADVSTVIHEYAHVIRRFLLNRDVPQDQRIDITDEEIAMLEEKCGVKDGNWDVPAEEKFAKMWEQYFFEGKSPNTLLDSLFEKISRWMHQVYQSAMSITGGTLDPEVRDLFDKMVQRQLPADQRTGARSRDGGKDKPPIYLSVTSDQWGDNLTSLANAAANATRERLKLPSLTEPASEGFQEWLDAAVVLMRNDPTYANRLVKELQQSSRSIDDVDVAVLNLHYRHLKNMSDAAANRLFKAIDDKQGDVAIVQARRESDALINEIEDFTDMTKKVGTEAGRALVARKIALAEDYTLGNLLLKARVANAGQPLSEAQLQEVRELADKIAKLEGDLAKEIQEKDDLARKLAAKESIDDTQKEVGKPVRNTATNRAVKKVENFVSKFVNIFGKRDDTTTLQQTEDEAMAEDGEEVIKSFVEAGVYSFGEFMSKFKAVIKGDVPVAARAALRKAWDKLKAQGDIPAPDMSDERQTAELRRLAKMVERNLVEFGITDPEEVIDGVHEALQEVFEDVTRREAMDAMSGYGQYSTPSQEPADKIIRDLNAQYQQMAKKDDMQQGIAPKKSGRGRDEPSDELRKLIREVNEMKRNSKYFITDPEAQLKTIFQATRTALRNRIYDLNKAIKAKEPIPGRTPNTFEGEQAKEIESLRKQRDELMADYKATFPKPGLTFEQRAAIAERAVDREITKIEQQLASGNVAAKERAEPISTPALKDKQNRLESLRAQREAVREMQMTDADREQRAERLERQAEKAYVANLLNRIADYEDRKAQGYFGPKPKKEPRTLSPREVELSRQLVSLKDEFFRYAAEYRLRNMSKVERFWDRTKETMHLSRAIMTSFDLSAVFRQGGIASLAHPKLAAAASREMLAALRRGDAEFDTMDKISKDELYTLAMRSGLSITTDSGKITRQEEAYMGRWAKWGIGKKGTKINELSLKALFFVAPSARSYTTFLNSMRFRVFKYMVSNLGAGGEVTIDEAKVIASYVNAATGRAELGKFNQAAANLNTVFFAPRYVASRFQYLAMPFYLLPSTKVSGRVKKMIAMEYARHAMGLTAFLGLSVALASLLTDDEEEKPTVEFDPRSSDFMKLKIGDTRIDPMAGLSQTVTLIGQMATGQKKGLRGDIKDLYGENRKFGDPDLWDVGTGFLRKKLAPIPGAIVDLRVGENVIGEKETVLSATTDLFVPLSFQEAGETMKARGLVGGAVVTALSLLGMGGGTYGPKTQYATADAAKREELFNKDLDRVKWNDPDLAYKDFLTTAQVDKFNKQREGRKQSLVFSAAADPKRKDYNSDETFKKSVEDRDKALDAIVKAGMGSKEIQLLLIAYYKRNYGSAYETREGVYQMKESLASRLQTIRRKLNEKKTPAK